MGDIRLCFEDQTRQLAVTDPSSPNLEKYERMKKLCDKGKKALINRKKHF
ncbi:MAG: hypothetical protein SPL57_02330 [Lachnospiraceae bacterium]|nr:hypothetical protein [Lachnospiraceae bacterium]